jgi:hypothetical protein
VAIKIRVLTGRWPRRSTARPRATTKPARQASRALQALTDLVRRGRGPARGRRRSARRGPTTTTTRWRLCRNKMSRRFSAES